MSNLLIGAYFGYSWERIEPWIKSAVRCVENTHIAVIQYTGHVASDVDETVMARLEGLGVEVVRKQLRFGDSIYHRRFYDIHAYIKNHPEFAFAITTDVRDVIFQRDPFPFLKQTLNDSNTRIYASSEGLLYKNEAWGRQNIEACFGEDGARLMNEPIFNAGVLSGHAPALADVCHLIYCMSMTVLYEKQNRQADQAAYNMIISSELGKAVVYRGQHDEGFAAQLGTTADPQKMDAFRPHLLCPEPTIIDDKVSTSDGRVFCIVHQYDRVPQLAKIGIIS